MNDKSRLLPAQIYCITFLLSFCSLSYELLIANTLSVISGYKILWQSLTIGVYLLSLGVGAYFSERTSRGDEYDSILKVEIKLAVTASLFFLFAKLIYSTAFIMNTELSLSFNEQGMFFMVPAVLCSFFTLVIGYYSGFELPLLIKAADHASVDHPENKILAFSYTGSLAGSLAVSLILFPMLDVLYSMVIVSGINMAVALYLVLKRIASLNLTRSAAIVLFLCISVGVSINKESVEQVYLKTNYLYGKYKEKTKGGVLPFFRSGARPVERIRSLYQYIDIVDYSPFDPENRMLAMNENFQFSNDEDRFYHEAFSHMPMMMLGTVPEKVLVLGAGDGLLVRELIKHEGITDITLIELDGEMQRLALEDPWLLSLNRDSMRNPAVKTVIGDAFSFVRKTGETYDALFIDFPYPHSFSTLRLYSYEFYSNVRKLLNPGGFIVVDGPLTQKEDLEEENDPYRKFNNLFMNTMKAAGMGTVHPYEYEGHSFVIASPEELTVDYAFDKNFPVAPLTFDQDVLYYLAVQSFPYELNRTFINSIFKPTIVYTPKYTY